MPVTADQVKQIRLQLDNIIDELKGLEAQLQQEEANPRYEGEPAPRMNRLR